jgi:hypothetical protein
MVARMARILRQRHQLVPAKNYACRGASVSLNFAATFQKKICKHHHSTWHRFKKCETIALEEVNAQNRPVHHPKKEFFEIP